MKIAIVVLVLIAVLFVATLVLGWHQNEASASLEQPDWLQTIKGHLGSKRVLPDELLADCLKGNTFLIPVGSTCRVRVLRSDTRLRKMQLRLLQKDEVSLHLEPNTDNGVAVNMKLDARLTKTPDLVFVKGRNDPPLVATLELKCERSATVPPTHCLLRLQ